MFKFKSHIIYEQLRTFNKDLFVLTGKLPNYESNGLIKQIRNLSVTTVQDFVEGQTRTSKGNTGESMEKCIVSIAKIASLIDLCESLGYVDSKTNERWGNICDDLTKRLYEAHKALH